MNKELVKKLNSGIGLPFTQYPYDHGYYCDSCRLVWDSWENCSTHMQKIHPTEYIPIMEWDRKRFVKKNYNYD